MMICIGVGMGGVGIWNETGHQCELVVVIHLCNAYSFDNLGYYVLEMKMEIGNNNGFGTTHYNHVTYCLCNFSKSNKNQDIFLLKPISTYTYDYFELV